MNKIYHLLSLLLAMTLTITQATAQNTEPESMTLAYQGFLTNLDRTFGEW